MKHSSDPNTGKPVPVAWYADPQPILFDQIEVGQGALFTRDELPEPVPVELVEDYFQGFDGVELGL